MYGKIPGVRFFPRTPCLMILADGKDLGMKSHAAVEVYESILFPLGLMDKSFWLWRYGVQALWNYTRLPGIALRAVYIIMIVYLALKTRAN